MSAAAGLGAAPRTAVIAPAGRLAVLRALRRRYLAGRLLLVTVLALAATAALVVWGVMAGSSDLGVGQTVLALLGAGEPSHEFIVRELRLPRVIGAVVVGLALGMSGALTQTFSRNPLATPDILGVTSGAAAGAVAAIVLGGGAYAVGSGLLGLGMPVVATIGALGTAAVVYGLSWRGGVDSYRLILIGIGATATLGGLTNYLMVRGSLSQAAAATQWLVGSLAGVTWTSVWPVLIVLLVITPLALTQTSALDIGQLGDEMSTGLGVPVQRHRIAVLVCAVVLCAAAVSAAGPVGFVAFVAPQLAQRLGRTPRPPLLASALLGAAMVTAADILGRAVLPWSVPVGIITAIIGAPYLIWLLTRRTAGGRSAA
ncbi:FecCD family ABC transporter permease [Brachybacterium phenoliresistens]|uniref:Iron-uptake system permease feuC n=1 Tax=Brachybacterium phenoliresistens TaxID=396014 RepID=Z9JNH2_9MICO|nr:iron chelate uptake ABC transporter family permease subunit [Brachybacterium phenoliresistens]EWS79513.1 Iron-uptake system permease feuC [Brachybacterium phenoliresistens]